MSWQDKWRNIEVRGVVYADVPALRRDFPDVSLRHIRYRLDIGRSDDIGLPLTCPVELDGEPFESQAAAARHHRCKSYIIKRYLDDWQDKLTFKQYLARLRRRARARR